MRTAAAVIAAAMLAVGAHPASLVVLGQGTAPNLLVNGDFESPVLTQPWIHLANGTSALPGWTTSGNGVELMRSYWQPAHGAQSVNLSSFGASEITQQVSTVAGAEYEISWYIAGNPQCTTPSTRVLSVLWNGVAVDMPTFTVTGNSFQAMGWSIQTTTVTAAGTTSSVGFLRAIATDGTCGVAIDDVGLQAVAVVTSPSSTTPASPQAAPGGHGTGAANGGSTGAPPAVPARSTVTTSLATPAAALSSWRNALLNAIIAVLAILLITFPAQLFNRTFDENYDDIVAFWERHLPIVKRIRGGLAARSNRRTKLGIVGAVVLAGALLGGLLDPHFGFNGPSATTLLSMIASTLWGIAVSTGVILAYRRLRHRETRWSLRALPAGLPIAICCVLVSRLTSFEPGYLYGIVCGAVFTEALAANEQGHTVAIATLVTVAIAALAWLAWLPVNSAAGHSGAAWPVVAVDDFLGALVSGGLIGATIGMVPLRFLPGGALAAWHRGAWTLVSAVVTFLFLQIMLNPARGGHPGHAALGTVIALFVVFGAASVAFAGHFARKKRRSAAVAPARG